MNLLMIGKTYLKLSDKENAKVYLMKAYEYPIVTVDDKQVTLPSFIHKLLEFIAL